MVGNIGLCWHKPAFAGLKICHQALQMPTLCRVDNRVCHGSKAPSKRPHSVDLYQCLRLRDHVISQGGFVWLFYGSKRMPAEERPDIPFVPELVDPAWRPTYGEIEFDCAHWSVFENAIDMAHIHYLHDNSFGNKEQPQIRDMTCKKLAWGVEAKFRLHNKPVNALWEFSKVNASPLWISSSSSLLYTDLPSICCLKHSHSARVALHQCLAPLLSPRLLSLNFVLTGRCTRASPSVPEAWLLHRQSIPTQMAQRSNMDCRLARESHKGLILCHAVGEAFFWQLPFQGPPLVSRIQYFHDASAAFMFLHSTADKDGSLCLQVTACKMRMSCSKMCISHFCTMLQYLKFQRHISGWTWKEVL